MINELRKLDFDVLACNHAEVVLINEFSDEVAELVSALLSVRIPAIEIVGSG